MTERVAIETSQSLESLEAVIERGLGTFVEVGAALLTIREGRLYRDTHESFETYCRERWGFSRQRAHQMIEAAGIVSELSTIVDAPPQNEAQARELARIPDPATRAEVWTTVREAHGEHVTAADIRRATSGPEPDLDTNGKLPIVDLVTGDVVRPRPMQHLPSSQSSMSDPGHTPSPALAAVPDIPEITPEERLYDQLVRLNSVTRYDPDVVAETVIRRRGMGSAAQYLDILDGALAWHAAFAAALRARSASPLQRIK